MLKDLFSLVGKTALVTGSARGIGKGIALGLAEYGAKVIVHGTKQSDRLAETLAEVRNLNSASEAAVADLSNPDEVEALPVDGVDILVCNVSVQERMPWYDFDSAEAHREMEINFHSTMRLFQKAYPHMRDAHWGRMIVVGSVQERRLHLMMCAFAASKGALENFVRNVARQVASEGITVNNLCPGVFYTDRNKDVLSNPEYAKQVTDAIPMRDYAMPEDAAGAAVLLASDAGRYITGATLMVDGGLSLPG